MSVGPTCNCPLLTPKRNEGPHCSLTLAIAAAAANRPFQGGPCSAMQQGGGPLVLLLLSFRGNREVFFIFYWNIKWALCLVRCFRQRGPGEAPGEIVPYLSRAPHKANETKKEGKKKRKKNLQKRDL